MAYPEFLETGWEIEVRALCGNLSTSEISDATLALDSYGPSSESRIKALIKDWDILVEDDENLLNFNRAAIRHVAAKVCDYLLVQQGMQSERIGGEYQYTKKDIDWPARKLELLNEFYEFLALIDPNAVSSLTYMDKIERVPAVFDEIEVEVDT